MKIIFDQFDLDPETLDDSSRGMVLHKHTLFSKNKDQIFTVHHQVLTNWYEVREHIPLAIVLLYLIKAPRIIFFLIWPI